AEHTTVHSSLRMRRYSPGNSAIARARSVGPLMVDQSDGAAVAGWNVTAAVPTYGHTSCPTCSGQLDKDATGAEDSHESGSQSVASASSGRGHRGATPSL